MDSHSGERDSKESRIKALYDELEAKLRKLSPDRLEALGEYLDDEQKAEADDTSGDDSEGD